MATNSFVLSSVSNAMSPWLASPIVQNLSFKTKLFSSMNLHQSVTAQLNTFLAQYSTTLPPNHPLHYPCTQQILFKLASLLDTTPLHNDRSTLLAFFPSPDSPPPTQTGQQNSDRFQLQARLLDSLIAVLLPTLQHTPVDVPPEVVTPSGTCPSRPEECYARAEWIVGKVTNMKQNMEEVVTQMANTTSTSTDAPTIQSGAQSAVPNQQLVTMRLDEMIRHHKRQKVAHTYLETFSMIARGLWGFVDDSKSTRTRDDSAAKILDLVTASSVIVPFFRIQFQTKGFNVNQLRVSGAVSAIKNPAFNISSQFSLNCEELLWMSTLNLLDKVHRGMSTQAIPDIMAMQHFLTQWDQPVNTPWSWPKLHDCLGTAAPTTAVIKSSRPNLSPEAGSPYPESISTFDSIPSMSTSRLPVQSTPAEFAALFDLIRQVTHTQVHTSHRRGQLAIQAAPVAPVVQAPLNVPQYHLPPATGPFSGFGPAPPLCHPVPSMEAVPLSTSDEGWRSSLQFIGPTGPLVHHRPSILPFNPEVPMAIDSSIQSPLETVMEQDGPGQADLPQLPPGTTLPQSMDLDPRPTEEGGWVGLTETEQNRETEQAEELDLIPPVATMPDPASPEPEDPSSSVTDVQPLLSKKRPRNNSSSSTSSAEVPLSKRIQLDPVVPASAGEEQPRRTGRSPTLQGDSNQPISHPKVSGKMLFPMTLYNTPALKKTDAAQLENFGSAKEGLKPVSNMYKEPKAIKTLSVSCPSSENPAQRINQVFNVPQVPKQARHHDWDMFEQLLEASKASTSSHPDWCSSICYLTPELASQMSAQNLGTMFSDHHIVILPGRQPQKGSGWVDSNGRITLDDIFDPDSLVECHDLHFSSLVNGQQQAVSRRSTIRNLLDHLYSGEGHILNLLDLGDHAHTIGQPTAVRRLASDVVAFNSTRYMTQAFPTFPHDLASWMLLAGGGAITRDHVDASGLATYVEVLEGPGKIWMICLGPKSPSNNLFDNSKPWIDDHWGNASKGFQFMRDNYVWEAIYLPAGSTLIMQPHTVHFVLTLGPTLCHGGHFYSIHTMNRSLHGRRIEHFHSGSLTNNTHKLSWVLLQRMVLYAHQKIFEQEESPYPLEQLAALVHMCIHPDLYTSQTETQPQQRGYQVQRAKAMLSARDHLGAWEPLQEHLVVLRTRAAEWQLYLRTECYDSKTGKVYPPGGSTEHEEEGSEVSNGDENGAESEEDDGSDSENSDGSGLGDD